MWELIIGVVLWGSVGVFDWVNDVIECMSNAWVWWFQKNIINKWILKK